MKKVLFVLLSTVILILLFSCAEKKENLTVNTHPSGWNDVNSQNFHGEVVLQTGTQNCTTCHGQNFGGGTSGVACADCHAVFPHPEGFASVSSPNFHGEYIKNNLNWHLTRCQDCHGVNFSGGRTGVSCRTCHTAPAGPEACNTCHGSMENIAPPKDLNNNVSRDSIGVGAHQQHVAHAMVTHNYNCTACHNPVAGFNDPNHIDNTPHSEIVFSDLATGTGNPEWNRSNATCSDVYCHGAFEYASGDSVITGNSNPVVWTSTNANPGDCTFCHGLPPRGHFGQDQYTTAASCASCHSSVVNADGTIKDLNKHINGEKDVF